MTPNSLCSSSDDSWTVTALTDQSPGSSAIDSSLPQHDHTAPTLRSPTSSSSTKGASRSPSRRMNPCAKSFTPQPDVAGLSTPSPANAVQSNWLFQPPPTAVGSGNAKLGDMSHQMTGTALSSPLCGFEGTGSGSEVCRGNLIPLTNNLTKPQFPVPTAVNHSTPVNYPPSRDESPYPNPLRIVVDGPGANLQED